MQGSDVYLKGQGHTQF